MSAALLNTLKHDPRFASLEAPYCELSAEQLLSYFHSRERVHYFSVLDETQVTPEKLHGILDNYFDFNNQAYQLPQGFDWLINPSSDIEWQILLHKFYYAVGLGRQFHETGDFRYRDAWQSLTQSWIATVPLDFLSSDVTGRRVQNWIFAYRYFVSLSEKPQIDAEFHLDYLASIQQQVAYLCQNLTPARNHRTLELYAIFLAAVVFPELKAAKHWLGFSIAELHKNLQNDLLADGVHCELSTDYHHIVLRNFLGIRRLAAMNHIPLPAEMDDAIQRALDFSLYAHKPDGLIPAISDGDTACFLELLEQGHQLYQNPALLYVASAGQQGQPPAERSKIFADSGYAILRSGWGEQGAAYQDERYLFFDCAALGAGNHGHLDLLNIEMAAYGRSLIVDPGRYTYDESGEINWRVLFRGTAYHNTVQIDGKNQTRYQAHSRKFKIQGPEPERQFKCALTRPGLDYLHGIAASDEYPVIHERKILFVGGEYWLICDLLRAEQLHDYQLRFHLDPSAQSKVTTDLLDEVFRVESPNLLTLQVAGKDTSLTLEQGYVSPSYGVKLPAPVLNFSQRAANCCFITLLLPYRDQQPDVKLECLPVEYAGKAVCQQTAIGLSITGRQVKDSFHDEIYLSHQPALNFSFAGQQSNSPFLLQRKDRHGRLLAWHDINSAKLDSGAKR